jgi:hypothetical protein
MFIKSFRTQQEKEYDFCESCVFLGHYKKYVLFYCDEPLSDCGEANSFNDYMCRMSDQNRNFSIESELDTFKHLFNNEQERQEIVEIFQRRFKYFTLIMDYGD